MYFNHKSSTKNNIFIKKEGAVRILDLPFYANKYFLRVFTSSNY